MKPFETAVKNPTIYARISDQALDSGELDRFCADDDRSGGQVLFRGVVRGSADGRAVARLEYEVHEAIAVNTMRTILQEVAASSALHFAGAIHRGGVVLPGQPAVLVLTAARHRRAAYQANEAIIHRIKHEAPIWKKEVFVDGTHRWGHNCEH
ncbi:MAG: molybdenum cofactor biosynthesis protein MoaE [Leptospiraceae bacterium]|nr:molybdenum cofactor biosynthesis protein MoaE [Leptospiraceae bacterium]MCP5485258.1 molybdenum cofactor biosynthesis protein MoaE [Spirochaetales bacterium]